MLLPLLVAVLSVFAGAALGIFSRHRAVSALSASVFGTFALVAALAVVLAQLLPDALGRVGLPALGVFALAAVLPAALQRLSARLAPRVRADFEAGDAHEHGSRWGLELGFVGLLVHKIADGVGIGTYGGPQHAEHGHLDVLLAIAAHTVPVVAVVAIAFYRHVGLRAALVRVFALAVATAFGVVLPSLVAASTYEVAEPWVTAAVAGLLLHVVTHHWHSDESPHELTGRLVDMAAVAAGVLLVLFASRGHAHGHGGAEVRESMGDALVELGFETAPALVLGLAIGAVLSAFGSKLPVAWLRRGSPMRQAVRGALVGAPLPICACGVLPLAASLKRRGAGAALVVAFLLATPELGVETLALTARFIGWPFALTRLVAAIALAILAALVVHRVARASGSTELAEESELAACEQDDESQPFLRRVLGHFDELVYHVGPWTIVGLVAAAYVQAVLPGDALGELRSYGLDILIVIAVAVPSYVCAASATPLAAVLLLKGMSPGAVLIGLLLGPATNLATVGFLNKSYGARATAFAIGALVLLAASFALVVNYVELPFEVAVGEEASHAHGPIAIASALILALAVLRSIWRAGLRPWLASLGESMSVGAGGHDHVHSHSHDHAH